MRALITGAAGAGTTTLAAALATLWGAAAIEADAIFWLPTDPPFQRRRDPDLRRVLLAQQCHRGEHAVVAGSVMGWGVDSLFDVVIFLYVDSSVRVRRLEARELARTGQVDPAFIQWAAQYDEGPPEGRSLARHEAWLRGLRCPIIRLEGDRAVSAQLALVVDALRGLNVGMADDAGA